MKDESWIGASTAVGLGVLCSVVGVIIGCTIFIWLNGWGVVMPVKTIPLWVQIASALATPVFAAAAAVIAAAQWNTSRRQARSALFERRASVYDRIQKAISEATVGSDVKGETIYLATTARREAVFLFGRQVQESIGQTEDKIVALRVIMARLSSLDRHNQQNTPQWNKAVEDDEALKDWLYKQADILHEQMLPYMKFQEP